MTYLKNGLLPNEILRRMIKITKNLMTKKNDKVSAIKTI